jgi:hypothetical protein
MILIYLVKHADLNELIHIQFREKKLVVHSNHVAENLQFFNVSYTFPAEIEKMMVRPT